MNTINYSKKNKIHLHIYAFFLSITISVIQFPIAASSINKESDEQIKVTHYVAMIRGEKIAYTVRAGFIPLRDDTTTEIARIFFVSYTADSKDGISRRPLTFYTNGGTGLPATLEGIAPRKITLPNNSAHKSQFKMVDNDDSWISFTDLVLIDPVGTGYSRATGEKRSEIYYNPEGDAQSITEFIRIYVKRYNYQLLQPIFIAGHSYGAIRSVKVAWYSQLYDVSIRGLILLSPPMSPLKEDDDKNFQGLLPTFTATAFYHKKLSHDLQNTLADALSESENWASTDYGDYLRKKDKITKDELIYASRKLEYLTGVPAKIYAENNLRIDSNTFLRNLLAENWDPAQLADSRVLPENISSVFDPDSQKKSMIMQTIYLGDELGVPQDTRYIDRMTDTTWPANPGETSYSKWKCDFFGCNRDKLVINQLEHALENNNSLYVLNVFGYYDLTAPYFSVVLEERDFSYQVRNRIKTLREEMGHYCPHCVREDVAQFIGDHAL